MSAGYDGKTIVWDVSFWVPFSFLLKFLFVTFSPGLSFHMMLLDSRFGKARQFGYMKFLISNWLMGSFLRKFILQVAKLILIYLIYLCFSVFTFAKAFSLVK